MPMQRTPEPCELMNDQAQALAYAGANFTEANQLFQHLLHQLHQMPLQGKALDLGCGPADIPIALLRQHPALQVDALDGADAMLTIARQRIAQDPGLSERLNLICDLLPSNALPPTNYDFFLSNSLLHHLNNPHDLWLSLQQCARDRASVLVMDLARPEDIKTVDQLVETYAGAEPEVLREDFRNSLLAAYTPQEVQQQLQDHGLDNITVRMVSNRHWAASGYYRTKSQNHTQGPF